MFVSYILAHHFERFVLLVFDDSYLNQDNKERILFLAFIRSCSF